MTSTTLNPWGAGTRRKLYFVVRTFSIQNVICFLCKVLSLIASKENTRFWEHNKALYPQSIICLLVRHGINNFSVKPKFQPIPNFKFWKLSLSGASPTPNTHLQSLCTTVRMPNQRAPGNYCKQLVNLTCQSENSNVLL